MVMQQLLGIEECPS